MDHPTFTITAITNNIKKRNLKSRFLAVLSKVTIFAVIVSMFFTGVDAVFGVSPLWSGNTAQGFAGGSGTETNPYLISTGEQLSYFCSQVNAGTAYEGKYIKLTQDILLNNMNPNGTFSGSPRQFTSIGTAAKPFKGHFDGAGYEVIGLYINKSGTDYQGLFGFAGNGSVIRDLKIAGSVAGGEKTGAVAGYTNGLIIDCEASCPITVHWKNYHGGIAGYAGADSIISNCIVSSSVKGTSYLGGVAGYTEGKITGCSSVSTLTGYSLVGGIVGHAAGINSEVSSCSFSGIVQDVNNFYTGGIAGQVDGLITGCTVNATLASKNSYVGGVAGYAAGAGSKITNCTITATVSAQGLSYAGGVVGLLDGEVSGCTVNISVSASNSFIGGIAGHSNGNLSVISDCAVSGTVFATAGQGYLGGVAGKTDGTITRCVCDCSVTGGEQHYIGGITGSASTGSVVSNSSSSGDITGNGKVGGIAGYTDGEIKICINTGDVNGGGSGHAGGIAGEAGNNSTVSNSFNDGAVTGSGQGNIGGIVGYASTDTVIHHNLNKGVVDGNNPKGSVVGNANAFENADNYWNNYYYDYEGAPTGAYGDDIDDADGAVPVGDLTWEEIQELLNGNNNPDGDDIWNQDLDDDGVPKPGGDGEGTEPGTAFQIVKSVIKESKHYAAALLEEEENGTAVDITADSVFTAAFRIKYNANCDPKNHIIKLKNNDGALAFPEGTSIIMLAGNAYYYINLDESLAEPITGIALGSFAKMGSTGEDDRYNPAGAATDDVKEYLFIFDFTRCSCSAENEIPAGSYNVELSHPGGNFTGTPLVVVDGKNEYSLSLVGANDAFTIGLVNGAAASGYDYKTDEKIFALEFYLEKELGNEEKERIPLPLGTKIKYPNGLTDFIAAARPYAFLPVDSNEQTTTIALDLSECSVPLNSGDSPLNYTLGARAYASADLLNPRSGYLLAEGEANITFNKPVVYAIRARAKDKRVFDPSLDSVLWDAGLVVPVAFEIQTLPAALGSNSVKATLQRKYGKVYVNEAGQADQTVTLSGGEAILSLPAESPKGTYRFVLTLYDGNGVERARSVENIIIK